MRVPKSTVRLKLVVQACGQPEPVTLWLNPRKDKRFQAAVEANRVLTVTQETVGTKKDFGVVGFHSGQNLGYWIFPKSLRRFAGKRVIGLDYSLLKQPKLGDRPAPEAGKRHKSKAPLPAQAPKPQPQPKSFRVTFRCTSTVEITHEVSASNVSEAKEVASARMSRKRIDFSRGTQSRVAVRVKKVTQESRDSAALFRRIRGLPDLGEGPGSNRR